MTRVLKFGGSSLADAAGLERARALLGRAGEGAHLVVLSACGDTTDVLLAAGEAAARGAQDLASDLLADLRARHVELAGDLGIRAPQQVLETLDELDALVRGVALLRELSPRSRDALCGCGERMSTALFAGLLEHHGVPVHLGDARTLMRTSDHFGRARPDRSALRVAVLERVLPELKAGRTVVVQGFVGATSDGRATTLGRGGSDWSAALFGAALEAREVQIWTDVEGVCTADPRVVAGAGPIERLSFAEAAELAAFGAGVLHPATIQPAVEADVPVTVRSTLHPDGRFSTIRRESSDARAVTALASRGPIVLFTVRSTDMLERSGFLARLFEVFGRLDVSVDLVATAEVAVSLSVEPDAPLERLRQEIETFATVDVRTDRALVALVGEHLRRSSGVAARAFQALEEVNVELISMGANEVNLSLVVEASQEAEAVRRLHAAFFER